MGLMRGSLVGDTMGFESFSSLELLSLLVAVVSQGPVLACLLGIACWELSLLSIAWLRLRLRLSDQTSHV